LNDSIAQGSAAIVTGGGSGIGRAVSEELARRGCSVVVLEMNEDGGRDTVEAIVADGGQATFHRCDVSMDGGVEGGVQLCLSKYGRLDYAVNSAGVVERAGATIADLDVAEFDRVASINLRGVFLSMQAELRAMRASGTGAIVNVASGAGLVGTPLSPAYNATKHGVVGLTKSASLDFASNGIRVNAVCPGVIDTPMNAATSPEILQLITKAHPIGRVGRADEVAKAAVWLCSRDASFVTGAMLTVDGGYTVP